MGGIGLSCTSTVGRGYKAVLYPNFLYRLVQGGTGFLTLPFSECNLLTAKVGMKADLLATKCARAAPTATMPSSDPSRPGVPILLRVAVVEPGRSAVPRPRRRVVTNGTQKKKVTCCRGHSTG